MAETKYVVKTLDTNINRIHKLARCAQLTFVLCLNVLITKRIWPTEMAIIGTKF